MEKVVESVYVATDDRAAGPAAISAGAITAVDDLHGHAGSVTILACRDLERAMQCVRRAQGRGHHAVVFYDETAAREFAEGIALGDRTWGAASP